MYNNSNGNGAITILSDQNGYCSLKNNKPTEVFNLVPTNKCPQSISTVSITIISGSDDHGPTVVASLSHGANAIPSIMDMQFRWERQRMLVTQSDVASFVSFHYGMPSTGNISLKASKGY